MSYLGLNESKYDLRLPLLNGKGSGYLTLKCCILLNSIFDRADEFHKFLSLGLTA